jgi:hypothetical protein
MLACSLCLPLWIAPLETPPVEVRLLPAIQTVPTGCIAEVDVQLSSSAPQLVAAVDVLLTWDPSRLQLIQALPSDEGWLVAAFLGDPDGINDDVTDGQALFTALANPASGLSLPPDRNVATFLFKALDSGTVALLPSLGAFGKTRVIGALPGLELPVTLSAPAVVIAQDVPSLEVVRLGTPPNPNAFRPGQTSGPVIGAIWDPVVDHSSFFPGPLVDLLGISPVPAPVDLPSVFGTFLIDIANPFLLFSSPAGQPFQLQVNFNCALVGRQAFAQAASLDAVDVVLTNALDLTVGTF